MSSRNGFTLIELVVVIAIVAIMATIAIPSFQGVIQGNKMSATARLLLSDIQNARSEAIRANNGVVSVCPSTNQTTCNTTSWNNPRIIFRSSDGSVSHVSDKPATTQTVVSAAGTLPFNSSGQFTGAVGTTLVICDKRTGNFGQNILITATGRTVVATAVACP